MDRERPLEVCGESVRSHQSEPDADQAATERQRERFGEELREDIARRAPTAIRIPISRVRSVTLTSMMFMMPMPPTSRETAAIAASNVVRIVRSLLLRCGHLGQIANREVVVHPRREPMAIAEQARDLVLRALGLIAPRSTLTKIAPIHVPTEPALNLGLERRDGHEARCRRNPARPAIGPSSLEHADHRKRDPADSHRMADRVVALAPHVIDDGLPEHHHLRGHRRRPPASNARPRATLQLRIVR